MRREKANPDPSQSYPIHMKNYDVYLETRGKTRGYTMAHVLSLPGCVCDGNSREEALGKVPSAIREYVAWLRRHGERTPIVKFELRVAEHVFGVKELGISGGMVATFKPDYMPVNEKEKERYFTLWRYVREDLLVLTETLPYSPYSKLKLRLAPSERSIREILSHISNADWWYLSRLVKGLEKECPGITREKPTDIFEHLAATRRLFIRRLESLKEDERRRVYVPKYFTKHKEEKWTYRKVLRRAIEHELEHLHEIEEILWKRNI